MDDRTFKEYLRKKVFSTIRKYRLLRKDHKIAVAVSGGKDSVTCLSILVRAGYKVDAITADPGIGRYTETNIANITTISREIGVTLHTIRFKDEFGSTLPEIQATLKKKGIEQSGCMTCGILKRYILNRFAREKGYDRLATGHNLDDEAQAFIMNVFRNDLTRAKRQGPVSGEVSQTGFVQRVKPLYLIKEEETTRYSKLMNFPVHYCICPYSATSYRRKFLNMLNSFEKDHPNVKYNILRFHEKISKDLTKSTTAEIGLCSTCGEPTSGKRCKACEIIKNIR